MLFVCFCIREGKMIGHVLRMFVNGEEVGEPTGYFFGDKNFGQYSGDEIMAALKSVIMILKRKMISGDELSESAYIILSRRTRKT